MDNPFLKDVPEEASGTNQYVMTTVNYIHTPLKTTLDLQHGGSRNKRWGAVISLGIIPGLDEMPTGPAILPQMPAQFFDGDDLDALRARLIHELDKAIELAKIQKSDPDRFNTICEEFYSSLQGVEEGR